MTKLNLSNTNLKQEFNDLSHLMSEIINELPLQLFIKDTGNDFRYIYASPLMKQVFGVFYDNVEGKTDFDLIPDKKAAQICRESDEEVVRIQGKVQTTELMKDPNGVIRVMDITKMLVNRENKSPYLIGMAWEVTKLKEVEYQLEDYNKRLAFACQVGKIYPWTWDFAKGTVELSTVMKGSIQPLFIVHKNFVGHIHPYDLKEYNHITQAFTKGEIDSFRVSFRSSYFTGEYVWYEKIGEVYERNSTGKSTKGIGVMRDITADKRHEADIQAKHLAEESNRMKSAFIANMSHEIRTPLNAIVGFSTLLAEADTQEEKQEYLKIIESSNDFLLQLISDILDISKIESGKMEFVFSTFSLDDVFIEQQESFALRAEPGVNIIFEKKGYEYMIHSERVRLTQVLINFLSNAIKFTTTGSIRFGYDVGDNEIYVYVKDTGAGIKKEFREKIFDRFVKLDTFKQGTGLGLSICKTIITMLNGEIGVESKEGKGSTFWFRIPCNPIRK